MSLGALAMFSSLIQNAQSTAGTLISAFGKTSAPSAPLMPLVWSGCRWETMTMSIALGSMPAAAMFAVSRPIGAFGVGAEAGIDQHQLRAGVDHLRIERDGHHALGHVGRFGGGERLLLGDVAHEAVGHRESAGAVADRGAFEARRPCSDRSSAPACRPAGAAARAGVAANGAKRGGSGSAPAKNWRRDNPVMAFLPCFGRVLRIGFF